jgi:hypothetical protein
MPDVQAERYALHKDPGLPAAVCFCFCLFYSYHTQQASVEDIALRVPILHMIPFAFESYAW